MEEKNQTTVTYFIFKGISDSPELQLPIFLLVLLFYVITLCGNMIVLLLVCLDPQLHTPMYFFLGNLSFLDMSSSTVTLHKSLTSFISGDNTITFLGCMAQFYSFALITIDELSILSAMSYDRYVAICNPLHYHMVMNNRLCVQLATVCYMLGFTSNLPFVILISGSSCFKSNIINHFFCDLVPLSRVICSKKSILEFYRLVDGVIGSGVPCILTIIPYFFIIKTIMNIQSSTGRRKAFYTCSSHLTVVILLYITLVCQYLRPTSMENMESNKVFSLFNTAAVPILNPLIYSLKNKDVKASFIRTFKRLKATI